MTRAGLDLLTLFEAQDLKKMYRKNVFILSVGRGVFFFIFRVLCEGSPVLFLFYSQQYCQSQLKNTICNTKVS